MAGLAFAMAGALASVVSVCVAPTVMPPTAGCVYMPPDEPWPELANMLEPWPPEPLDAMEIVTIAAAAVKPKIAPNRLPCRKIDVC
jgi:hypothetical protein